MNFSAEWESVYASGKQLSIWPWSDLVSYVMRYAKPAKTGVKVLELGSGAGANIPFFKQLGVEYYGLDGSRSAVEKLRKRFPEYSEHIRVGDFTIDIPFDVTFDLVVDRASLTHNATAAIRNCLTFIKKRLGKGGMFIGIDWFSTEHSDFRLGSFVDLNTKENFPEGNFEARGKTHFSDKKHLLELFEDFTITELEHKIVIEEIPPEGRTFASWNFVAHKEE